MPAAIYQHTFPNGLTLLAERMEHVRSAAVNFLVPAGCVYDPPEQAGIGSMLADLITRGGKSLAGWNIRIGKGTPVVFKTVTP